MKNDREYRTADIKVVERSEQNNNFYVEGYASTFEKYLLFSYEGVDYYEEIDRHAFDECDMSDVVFRIDHEGRVYARTSNGLIKLSVDDIGLFNRTDLSATDGAKEIYEDIRVGNYPKMSFAFKVREDSYDSETHTRKVLKVSKLYDISPVSFPANPGTSLGVARSLENLDLETRNYFNGVIKAEEAERLAREERERARGELVERLNSLKKGQNYGN